MANAIVEYKFGAPGFSLTVNLYPFGSDTVALNAAAFTEATNRKGLYTLTTGAGLTGMYDAFIYNGSVLVDVGVVWMANDTNVHRIAESVAAITIQDATGSIPLIAAGSAGGLVLFSSQRIKKNQAYNGFMFFVRLASNPTQGATGLASALAAKVAIDGASFVTCVNSATIVEIGFGWYSINLAQQDTNGNNLAFRFFSGSSIDTPIHVLTE
jgi:hypothetical protein